MEKVGMITKESYDSEVSKNEKLKNTIDIFKTGFEPVFEVADVDFNLE